MSRLEQPAIVVVVVFAAAQFVRPQRTQDVATICAAAGQAQVGARP